MAPFLGIALITGLALLLGSSTARTGPPHKPVRPRKPRVSPPGEESASELAGYDPVSALMRYGTPEDAARLAEQGIDLSRLGYKP